MSSLDKNARLFSTHIPSANNEKTVESSYYKQQGSKQAQDTGLPADWDSALPYEKLPGPKPWPIIGNTWRFIFGEFKSLDFAIINSNMHKKYGKIASIKGVSGIRDMVNLYDPADMEKLFRNEGIWPHREVMPSLTEYRTEIRPEIFKDSSGLLTVHGEEWFNTRTAVNPILMQPKPILSYALAMDTVTADLVKWVKKFSASHPNNEMPENFEQYIQNWSLESIAYVALDCRLGCLDENQNPEAKEIIAAVTRIFRAFLELDFGPMGVIHKRFKTKTYRQFIEDMDFVTFTIRKYINEAIETIKKQNLGDKPSDEISILQKLLLTNAKTAITMTNDMIMAGVETTTKAAGIALYLLAKNKDAQTKLREELVSLLPTPETPISKEVLSNAPYLRAVNKEAMRLEPVATGNIRTLTKEIVLGGYQIPRGVDVGAFSGTISVVEGFYHRPTEFLPERWLRTTTGELSQKNVSPFVTLPFGFGPRSCVGKRVANLEMEMLIAKIVRNFELDWPHKDMKFKTTLTHGCADPLRLKMTPVLN